MSAFAEQPSPSEEQLMSQLEGESCRVLHERVDDGEILGMSADGRLFVKKTNDGLYYVSCAMSLDPEAEDEVIMYWGIDKKMLVQVQELSPTRLLLTRNNHVGLYEKHGGYWSVSRPTLSLDESNQHIEAAVSTTDGKLIVQVADVVDGMTSIPAVTRQSFLVYQGTPSTQSEAT